jgi:hypothetical protein
MLINRLLRIALLLSILDLGLEQAWPVGRRSGVLCGRSVW